ncbi:MAG: pimeloyl-ACP methyl ester carboxylesterase [Myxococcota bacterium]|jgi:pimeloyl-ACP methyl ester carboxylesterase
MILVLSLLACNGDKSDDTSTAVDDAPDYDCDPIAPTLCGLPFPSTFYMAQDATTATGWRVNLGPTTMPINANDQQPDPWTWNERDGWTVAGPIMAHFPEMSLTGVASHADIGASILDASPTLLIDADTGERIPHFVELDMSHDDDTRRMLMLYPTAPLDYGTRYLVAIRGLTDTAGSPIDPSDAFKALRDGTATDDEVAESRRAYMDASVFPPLETAGVSRDDLILAWDFVTGSKDGITGRAVWIRDDLYDRIDAGEMTYTITEVEENPTEYVGRRIFGEVTVPLYAEEDYRGSLLTRGDDGMPYYNGTTTVPFIVVVPERLIAEGTPGAVIQYGHGLLGSHEEVTWGGHSYLPQLANEYGYVLISVDWTGMSDDDEDSIKLMLVNEIDKFAMIPERSHQGFAEFLATMRLIGGALAEDDLMQVTDPKSGESRTVVSEEGRYYYGNSQGGILGGAYAAISSDVERATFGVGGAPYSLLLFRSEDFSAFFQIFQTMYPNPLNVALWMGYMQTLWDSGESAGYLRTYQESPLAGNGPKKALLQVAIGDAQVTTLGAEFQARGLGASFIEAPAREVWGIDTVKSGSTGSGLVEWDYGVSEPFENIPPSEDTDTHEGPRRELAAMEQLHLFFSTGELVNTCDGVCTGTLED